MAGSGLTGRSTRTRTGKVPQDVCSPTRLAAPCRCVPVNSDVGLHGNDELSNHYLKVGNLVHQTLDGDRIVTVSCFTEQQRFQLIFNELGAVAASFRFLK